MTGLETTDLYGTATIDPEGEVVAGGRGTWKLTYVVGSKGVASGGAVRASTECDTDWGIPQFDDPEGAEYMTLQAPDDARVSLLVEDVKSVLMVVHGRGLVQGEKLVLTYGDRECGGPGSRAQTFLEERRYFWVSVDTKGDGKFITLAESPHVSVIGGPAVRLAAIVPSTAIVGEPFRLLIRAEDEWGNPAKRHEGTVEINAEGIVVPGDRHGFSREDYGLLNVDGLVASEAGAHRIEVSDTKANLATRSNPVLCTERPPRHGLYWADPHGGQIAMNTKIPDFLRYARDVSRLDFVGYQRNDHVVSKEDWARQQEAEVEFYEPGRFVPVPGYEWSPRTFNGGHHNVYFRRHNLPIRRNSHDGVEDKSDMDTDIGHVLDLYREFRGADLILTPHVGGYHADLTYHEPTLEPALEITSTHGTFEWFLEETLRRRYKMGFLGGSDSHTGRPGNDVPGHQLRRYAKAGLTGVYADEVSLDAFIEALRARRCYATTGARIIMRVDGDGHPMGSEYTTASSPTLSVSVHGTAPLETVEVFRGMTKVHDHPVEVPRHTRRVRILWEGASRKTSYSGVVWDGVARVTGGTIASVEKVRFDSPRSSVGDVTGDGLRWHSVTCGYRSGVILTMAGDSDAEIEVTISTSVITGPSYGEHGEVGPMRMSYSPTERLTFSVGLADLKSGAKQFGLGVLNRKVTVSLAPGQSGPQSAEFSFEDPSPPPGTSAYWVRVVQGDMEMAWSSPVFVDYAGTP